MADTATCCGRRPTTACELRTSRTCWTAAPATVHRAPRRRAVQRPARQRHRGRRHSTATAPARRRRAAARLLAVLGDGDTGGDGATPPSPARPDAARVREEGDGPCLGSNSATGSTPASTGSATTCPGSSTPSTPSSPACTTASTPCSARPEPLLLAGILAVLAWWLRGLLRRRPRLRRASRSSTPSSCGTTR